MKLKYKLFLNVSIAIPLFITGYLLTNSTQHKLCTSTETSFDASCVNLLERIGDPMFYGGGALLAVFILLLLIPKAVPTWNKFAIWFIPATTLLFIFYPDPGSGDLFSPYPETVFQFMSAVYVLVSVVLIAYAYIRKRG
jgi:hypothetical protein